MIIDIFAGPGGWDEGLLTLGRSDAIGIEWEKYACATARAAGHRRAQADVSTLDPTRLGVGDVDGLIGSPPCQAWSMAGKRGGESDRTHCHELADRMATGDDSTDWTSWEDERSPLVCQPIRWVRDLQPEWVALEEVPQVASLWEHFTRILDGWGYSTWTGDLCAADYGVPQTRTRRILIASRARKVGPPPPTHSKVAHGEDLLGGCTLPWVTMGEALGWGFDEPSATISGGGSASGGAEPFANAGHRRRLTEIVTNQRSPGSDEYYSRPTDRPAPTITTNSGLWKVRAGERPPVYVNGSQPNAGRRSIDEPAPTIQFGHRANDVRWVLERPATTVDGSFRPDVISAPGYRTTTSRQDAPGSVRVTVQDVATLQGFRMDYPWQGPKTKQFEQVGNAVPPRLAAHVLAVAMGMPVPKERAA